MEAAASSCLSAILSKIGGYLLDLCVAQANYLLHFENNVEDLKKEDENLRVTRDRVQNKVERAKRNTEEIEKDVEKWLMDVKNVLEEIQWLKDEIELNKTFLCERCKLGRRAVKKTSEMSKLRESGNFSRVSHPTTLPGVERPKDFMSFKPTEYAFSQIVEALKNDKINMVGLYGMGGVGKTTLAKAVGNKAGEEKLFDEVVMVAVTQDPDVKNIQSQIADLLGLKFEEETIIGRAQRLCLRLEDEKKTLLILDDVWKILNLTTIGIPFGDDHKGCTILLTTRRQQVCIDMKCQTRIQLDTLNEEGGLILFKKHASICNDSPTLNAAAKEVVGECGGLPIAIKAIGSALREKDVDEWKVVSEKLKMSKFPDIEAVDQNVYACLKLSYDYLKAEETKFCFLLCSLFPEDYEIDLEELLRYGLGLDLYGDANTIEAARRQLRVTINNLKSSCLLLDAKEGFVKMHDLVRDVALWITSKGENVFMVKAGMRLKEWPKHQGLEQCTAISLMGNRIEVLPNGLVCPKLNILLLKGNYGVKVSEEFFEEMKTLKVASLDFVHLSLNSLQSLTNLVTLQLINCKLSDISSIKKLAQLEILKLEDDVIVELPEELGELGKLRMLDITDCSALERIPVNVIPRLSLLEELYIGCSSFTEWEVEGTSAEGSNASLSDLSKLSRLTILSLCINVQPCLLKDFVLTTNLLRYDIRVNDYDDDDYDEGASYPKSRHLKIKDIEATSLVAFKALYEKVEYLELDWIEGCCQNMVPSIDATGLNELKRLSIWGFDELECIIDTTQQQEYVFQPKGLCYAKENPFLLSSLESLHLDGLRNLSYIWKGPTQQVSLQSLTVVEVKDCDELRYIFTLSLARSLLQLEQLIVQECGNLEYIVKKQEAEENVGGGGGNDVMFPKLRKLRLDRLENFISFFDSQNYSSTWPALQELSLNLPLNSTTSFVAQLEANVLQTLKEKLRVLDVEIMNDQLCNTVLAQLIHGFQNLEELTIRWCRVSQLELSLPSLKVLVLQYLKELEWSCKGPTHLLSLPNLKILKVDGCYRLRHMFSPSLARNLLQLEELSIKDCGELEQIFNEDDAADMTSHREMVLPKLQKLTLQQLESLINFCPVGYHFIFPSLSKLVVTKCPKLTTRFSVDQNRSVHAETEAPETGTEDVDMEQSPLETTKEIDCWNPNSLWKRLPPYIEKL